MFREHIYYVQINHLVQTVQTNTLVEVRDGRVILKTDDGGRVVLKNYHNCLYDLHQIIGLHLICSLFAHIQVQHITAHSACKLRKSIVRSSEQRQNQLKVYGLTLPTGLDI